MSKKQLLGLFLLFASMVTGVLAGGITLNSNSSIELGVGQSENSICSTTPTISINSSYDANENLMVSSVRLTQIPVGCAGQQLELRLLGSSNQVLETIFWQLSRVNNSDTSITAIADGTSTSTSNSSTNSVSMNYPNANLNDPDPGLALESIDVSNVLGFRLLSTN